VSYVTAKAKGSEEIGMHEETVRLPADTPEEEVLKTVDKLNRDPKFHGILVQLPLPKHINTDKVINYISPEKDVDGFHPVNVGKALRGEPCPLPCTPHGIIHLLLRNGVKIEGAHTVIVGRSNIVGKPLANMLMQKADGANATVTVAHSRTENLPEVVGSADVLVAAIGRAEMIPGDWIKPGAVVIDVGVNRVEDSTARRGYRLVGDVHFESASKVASRITPVPGGVGPMTRVMLMKNTVASAEMALARRGE